MSDPIIRSGHADEYDEIARIWMQSWVSTGLAEESRGLTEQAPDTNEATRDLIPIGASRS